MKKSLLAVLLAISGSASAEEITGHVYQNSSPIEKVCGGLLLKTEPRCESQDDYMVVAIAFKETETDDAVDIEAVNALIKKDEFAKYFDQKVKATVEPGQLAHITQVIN